MININPENEGFKKSIEKQITESSHILNDKTNEYLIKLLKLEESAIRKDALSENELKALKKLSFFDSIILYNLYNLAKKYTSDYPNTRILSNIYGFLVEYKDKEKIELLKFINKEMSIYLYDKQLKEVKTKLEEIKKEIERLEQRVDFFKDCLYISESQKQSVAKRLHKLKQMTPESLERQYEYSVKEYEHQKIMTQKLLQENGLTENDFEEMNMQGGKKFLIKKYPHATICIEK